VACAIGPGLAACLEAGCNTAFQFAASNSLPFVGVHHMEAHALTAQLCDPVGTLSSALRQPANEHLTPPPLVLSSG
jgi:tRNA A37 threonylcarbamoyltransferase TsaD